MLTKRNIEGCMLELSNTTSDMLVGLKCLDSLEVEREARRLKEQANEYGLTLLGQTAYNIELAATAGDMDTAQQLVPELHERILQARESLQEFSAQSPSSQKYARISVKA